MRTLVFIVSALAAACGSDAPTPDAAAGIDADPSAPDAAPGTPDAAAACVLDPTPLTCSDDAPCEAVCGGAYCYNFNMVGMVCTNACSVGGDCPAGWSCNNMGRCRPPN